MNNKLLEYVCKYCGRDTSLVEADYVVGVDHLECILEEQKKVLSSRFSLNINSTLIEQTPNDQELGEKIRIMYHEAKNNS